MEPPSTPGRTPRQDASAHGQSAPTTSAASPFSPNDPGSPRMRASTMAFGPRMRTAQPSPSPPTPKAPSAPKQAPKTPMLQQQGGYGFSSDSTSNLATTPNSAGSNYPASTATPRTPVRVPSRGHQRVPSGHRTVMAQHQRTPSATHSRTPSSASYNRQKVMAEMQTSGGASIVNTNHGTPAGAAVPAALAAPIPASGAAPAAAAAAAVATTATTTTTTTTTVAKSSTSSHRKPQKRTSIGPWEFVKSIGAGSMGQVKLAVHKNTKQMAAVKIVPKAFTHRSRDGKESNEAKDARVIREAAIGRLLDHPNISKLYDVYSMTGHFYLVFEYIAGGQMLDYIISHGCVKESQARRFARSISSALDYCHHNSVVHRDLKIENILIADDGDIRLIDFGLSNLFRRDDLLRTFCGSLYFAAPELLNAMPYVGPEIDVWSFGVVLYVLVSGKVPFEDKSMSVLHSKIKRGTVDYPQWLSSLCVDLLSRMLTVNPSERATLSEVMHHPWMMKGYEGPPTSFVPRRLPLTLDSLDPQVMEEMEALGIGDAHNIEMSLRNVLGSAEYQAALDNWYDRQEVDLASSRGSSSAGTISAQTLTTSLFDAKTADPLDSFSPEISCYFLTKERMSRMRVASTSSSKSSLHAQLQRAASDVTPTAIESKQVKTLQQAVPFDSAPPRHVSPPKPDISSPDPGIRSGRQRSKTLEAAYEIPQPTFTPSQAPAMPTPGVEQFPQRAYVSNVAQQAKVGLVTPMSAVKPIDLDTIAAGSSPRERNPSRIVSQPITSNMHQQQHLQLQQQLQLQQEQQQLQQQQQQQLQQPLSLFRKLSLRRKSAGHKRAKSTSHATPDQFESRRESSNHRNYTPSQQNLETMPSIESPKPVFFRGIFSVQSTSTKPLYEIRSEIIRVLTEKQIEYVEVRGGFACVARQKNSQQYGHYQAQHHHHQEHLAPSRLERKTSSSSSMYANNGGSNNSSGSGGATNMNGITESIGSGKPMFGEHLVPPSPQTPPATPRHRRMISENGIVSPAVSIGGSSDSIDIEIGASDMLGESRQNASIPIRFEIDIVRVPIVSLHGIQFKKMTGNVWQYKNLAQEILEALRI